MSERNLYGGFPERVAKAIDLIGGPAEVMRKTGVTLTTLARWKKGEADPSRMNLIKMAEAAEVNIAWLATGEGPMRTESVASANHSPGIAGGDRQADEDRSKQAPAQVIDLEQHREAVDDLDYVLLTKVADAFDYFWEERGMEPPPVEIESAMVEHVYKHFADKKNVTVDGILGHLRRLKNILIKSA
ncbi:helix-turn-helix transcriptional regulator [Chitinivorax sp. PXF-14]|uniref:helix-turn-helix domain-containing protein n=1 Tax=Chitinivorax sp. PXF-14 TaxID=3230488 RepID=UPI0034669B20